MCNQDTAYRPDLLIAVLLGVMGLNSSKLSLWSVALFLVEQFKSMWTSDFKESEKSYMILLQFAKNKYFW